MGSTSDRLAEGFDEVLRRYETDEFSAQVARQAWKNSAKEAVAEGGRAPLMPAEAVEPPQPERPRIRVGDATAENGNRSASKARGVGFAINAACQAGDDRKSGF